MKTLIAYDSQYGNTEKIAQAIAESISTKAIRVSDIKNTDLTDIELLVLGTPTQGGKSTAVMQDFLSTMDFETFKKVKFAVFDTRFLEEDLNLPLKLLVKTIGYAAPKMAEFIKSKNGKLAISPEGFIVKRKEGPLAEGELERARKWIASI